MSFLVLALVLLVVAGLCDFWWHEVPDWLNLSFLASGVGLSILLSILDYSWIPFLTSILGIVIFGILGFSMFFSGQWGGGDVKTLLALGSLIGVWFDIENFGVSFILNIFPSAALYGLAWFAFLVWIHFSSVKNSLKRHKHFMNIIKPSLIIIVIIVIISIILPPFYRSISLSLGIGIPVLLMLSYIVKSVESVAFIKRISPYSLTEGDWLASPIIVHGKTIVKSGGTGVSIEDMQLIQNLHKKGIVKKVTVKYGLPFVPAFLLTFILTLMFGNIFFLVLL